MLILKDSTLFIYFHSGGFSGSTNLTGSIKGDEIILTSTVDCLYPYNPLVQVQYSYEVIKDNRSNRYLSISGDLLPLVFARRRRLCVSHRLLAILHFLFLKTGHQMLSAGIPVS